MKKQVKPVRDQRIVKHEGDRIQCRGKGSALSLIEDLKAVGVNAWRFQDTVIVRKQEVTR